MMNRSLCNFPPARQQRGAALIVALIMLLLLTMIGVAGMRDNQLQEKMAGTNEDRSTAFQAAEAALRAAESELSASGGAVNYTGGCQPGTCYQDYSAGFTNGGYLTTTGRQCSGTACSELAYWKQFAWSTGTNSKAYAGSGLTEVTSQPRYVIERMPSTYSAVLGTKNASSTNTYTVVDFLITARATGRTSDAVVILQSVYRVYY